MTSAPSAPSTSDPVARGQALLESGSYSEALVLFDEALRANPSNFLALFDRSRCHQGLGNWTEAVQGFSDALRLDATELAAYLNRGTCRGNLADHEGAAEDLERYVDGRPERGDIWMDLGDRRLDAGFYARAADAYEKAALLLPAKAQELAPWVERARKLDTLKASGPKIDLAAACRERGWAKFQAGGFRTATMWFNRAIDAVPEDGTAWHGRGVSRSRLGQLVEAVADLEKAVKLSPESADAWIDLGRCRSQQGDAVGALSAAEEAIRHKPDSMEAIFLRGLAKGKLGDFRSAEAEFTRCVEANAKDSLSWLNRGWTRRKMGHPKEAVEDLGRSIDLDPSHPLAFYHRGFARRELGDQPGSMDDFRKAMALDPSMASELTPLVSTTADVPPPSPVLPSPAPSAGRTVPPPARDPSPAHTNPGEWTGTGIAVVYVILIAFLGLGIARIPYLGGVSARALDIPYKATWVIAHWTDEVAFPHECNLCMEPFCTRTDVTKKHVCGRPRYSSETKWRYCPAHEAGMICTDTRLDAFVMLPYMGLSLILSAFTVAMVLIIPVRLLLLPVVATQVLRGKQPKSALWPFLAEEDTWLYSTDVFVVIGGLVLFLAMLLMYMIW